MKTIYLTFDDGPSVYTEDFLNLLRKYNAKATFFLLGEMIGGHENAVKRIAEEGHAIGVHGYTHTYEIIYQNTKVFWEDNLRARKMIEDITGKTSAIMRFPGGSSNTISRRYCPGIMSRLAEQASDHGYVYFDWNICPDDATDRGRTLREYYDRIIDQLTNNFRIPVILLHDTDMSFINIGLVEKILSDCISEGYDFGILNEDTPPVHHVIAN